MQCKTQIVEKIFILGLGLLLGIILSGRSVEAQPRRKPTVQRPSSPALPQGARNTEIKSSAKSDLANSKTNELNNTNQIISQQNIDQAMRILFNHNNTTTLLEQSVSTANYESPGPYQISSWATADFAGYFIIDTRTGIVFDKAKFSISQIKTDSETKEN